jgi:hypothetical protein
VVFAEASGFCLPGRAVECERAVRPMLVVMARVDAEHVLELPPAEDEQAVEALASHGADPALGVQATNSIRRLPSEMKKRT